MVSSTAPGVDFDQDAVELSNLHRQIAHRQASVGMHKADSAADACRALNSSIQVQSFFPRYPFLFCIAPKFTTEISILESSRLGSKRILRKASHAEPHQAEKMDGQRTVSQCRCMHIGRASRQQTH